MYKKCLLPVIQKQFIGLIVRLKKAVEKCKACILLILVYVLYILNKDVCE